VINISADIKFNNARHTEVLHCCQCKTRRAFRLERTRSHSQYFPSARQASLTRGLMTWTGGVCLGHSTVLTHIAMYCSIHCQHYHFTMQTNNFAMLIFSIFCLRTFWQVTVGKWDPVSITHCSSGNHLGLMVLSWEWVLLTADSTSCISCHDWDQTTDLYEVPDAVPPIHAVSSHITTDKDPSKFRSIFSDNLQPIATCTKKARGTLLVDIGCSSKHAPPSVSYYNEISSGHIWRGCC